MAIPTPIRKWVQEYITGTGSSEVASQAPVQSVNSQIGDVTVATGSTPAAVVQTYDDLPVQNVTTRELYYVDNATDGDFVYPTQLSPDPVRWVSLIDGAVVASATPDGVVTQYRYEGDFTDSVGSNDATNNGTTLVTSPVKKGAEASYVDNDGDSVTSNSTVDLAANNVTDELSAGGFIQGDSIGRWCGPGLFIDQSNYAFVTANSDYEAILSVGGSSVTATSSITPSASSWDHVMVVVDASEIAIVINGTTEATTSHSLTPSNLGSGTLKVGSLDGSFTGGTHYHDDSTFADKRLTETEINELINR